MTHEALPEGQGGCWEAPNLIRLSSSLGSAPALHAFCHELGHWHCDREGIWKAYHHDLEPDRIVRTGVKAEKWVSRWGRAFYRRNKLHKRFGPYRDAYLDEPPREIRKWIREVALGEFGLRRG